jgi:hypothetical protein
MDGWDFGAGTLGFSAMNCNFRIIEIVYVLITSQRSRHRNTLLGHGIGISKSAE